MSDLKPCPFCGCEMKLDHELAYYGDRVFHPDNGCQVTPFATEPKDWNTRPIEDKLTAELAAARAEIERLREGLGMYADPSHWANRGSVRDVWAVGAYGWEMAERCLTCPPSPAFAPEAPRQAQNDRQTDPRRG